MFKIKDNKLITTEHVFCVKTSYDTLEVVGEYPISSRVFCKVKGANLNYTFPLSYEATTEDGNVFSSIFYLDDNFINYYHNNPTAEYKFSIIINNVNIDNEQIFTINPKLSSNNSIIKDSLLKQINDIRQELVAYKSSRLKVNKKLQKGMVPIATGFNNDYTWDYPFNDIMNKLIKVAELENNIANHLNDLTNRVNDLEKQLLEHIYEGYNI